MTDKAETTDNETCIHCEKAVYQTQTARGTEWAHTASKVLFCTSKAEVRVHITETTETPEDMATLLREIARLIDAGNTSGYYPHWSLA